MAYRTLAKHKGVEIVREYEPMKRSITIGNGREFLLQMPYMLFMRVRDTLFVAFSSKKITSMKDVIYCATLGNVYPSWQVCGCSGTSSMQEAIDVFWKSKFTNDGMAGPGALRKVFNTYNEWSKLELETIIEKIEKNDPTHMTFQKFLMLPWSRDFGYDITDNRLPSFELSINSKYPDKETFRTLRAKIKKSKMKPEVSDPDINQMLNRAGRDTSQTLNRADQEEEDFLWTERPDEYDEYDDY